MCDTSNRLGKEEGKVALRSEANVLNDCLVALSNAGAMVWRQNTGVLKDARGRPVRFGLCVGSSDIIGICPDGVFLAVECKTQKGRATDKQLTFIRNVQKQGGRAGIARCGEDAVDIMLGRA